MAIKVPFWNRTSYSHLPRTMPRRILKEKVPLRREALQPLWAFCAVSLGWKLPHLTLCLLPVVAEYHWKEPGCSPFSPYLQVFVYTDKIPPEPSLLKAELYKLCQIWSYQHHRKKTEVVVKVYEHLISALRTEE